MPGKLGEKGIRVYLTLPAEIKEKKQVKEINAEQFADTVTLRRIRADGPLDGGSLSGRVSPRHEKASRRVDEKLGFPVYFGSLTGFLAAQ